MCKMVHLIKTNEVADLSRPISGHIDDKKINTYIRESEDIDLKSSLGDVLLMDIRSNPEKYDDLLNGGEYEDKCGYKHTFSGLKRALAYYSYARIVKNNDINVTRFGVTFKEDDYSDKVSVKERILAYNDAFSIADKYLHECVLFLSENKDKYPLYRGIGKVKANRINFRTIGD